MKSVLLTGATGFIGSQAILPLLEKGFELHAVTSKSVVPSSAENITWHWADLLAANEIENLLKTVRPTHLLHFAWYVEHGKFWNAPENLEWVTASLFLMRKFAEFGGRRIVAAGTNFEYGEPIGEFVSENVSLNPQSLYAASKAALYLTAEKYAKVADISFAWGRVFFLFGENEAPRRLVASVAQSLLRGEIAKTSHGNQIRDFMNTKEVAAAFVALLDSDVQGAVNVASGEPRTIREVVCQIADLTGNRENIEFGAVAPPVGEPPRLVANVARLREEVKWQPAKSFASQMDETVDWWRRRLKR